MLLTVLEAQIDRGREPALEAAYAAAGRGNLPPGLIRSELLRDANDPTRWRIQTWWTGRVALDAMRASGTPAGVLMFRAAGGEPVLSIFEVVAGLPVGAAE